MPFITIPTSIISVGKAIKREIFQIVKDDLDDHEARLNQLETTSPKIEPFKFLMLNGSVFSTATGIAYYEADTNFILTDAFIRIFEKGSLSGTIQIDIKKSTTDLAPASFTSVFTTRPSITFASVGNYAQSTNQVFDPTKIQILQGDYLRLDITQAPTNGVLPKLLISAYGE